MIFERIRDRVLRKVEAVVPLLGRDCPRCGARLMRRPYSPHWQTHFECAECWSSFTLQNGNRSGLMNKPGEKLIMGRSQNPTYRAPVLALPAGASSGGTSDAPAAKERRGVTGRGVAPQTMDTVPNVRAMDNGEREDMLHQRRFRAQEKGSILTVRDRSKTASVHQKRMSAAEFDDRLRLKLAECAR